MQSTKGKKVISSLLIGVYIFSIFSSFSSFSSEVFATGTSGLNEAPDIVSSSSFTIRVGDTNVGVVSANDEDNVVMEYGTTNVTGNTWKNISHSEMCNPVVVTSNRNDVNGLKRAIPRAKSKTATSFDLKVDNQLANIPATQVSQMDYIVVNEGVHDFIDDNNATLHIQAGSESTGIIFGNSCRSNNGALVNFNPSFNSDPSVIHSISSDNEPLSIGSSAVGNTGTYTSDPSTTQMGLMMQTAFGSCTHAAEDIDYIASEPGHFVFDGVELDTAKGADVVASVTNTGNNVSFFNPFSSVPQTVLVSMLGIDGANGGTAHVHSEGTITTSQVPATIDEDASIESTGRSHTNEPVGIFAFENTNGKITQPVVLDYSISGGANAADFNIDQTTGQITTGGSLPVGSYSLDVEVCDDHCNSQCNTQSITVTVQDGAPTITGNNITTILSSDLDGDGQGDTGDTIQVTWDSTADGNNLPDSPVGATFDGVDDSVEFGDNSDLKPSGDFSIGIWATPESIATWNGMVSSIPSWGTGYGLQMGTAQGIAAMVSGTYLRSNITPVVGTEYHVVLTHTETGELNKIYVNGVLQNSNVRDITYVANTPVTLGNFYTYGALRFDGEMSDFQLYDKVLTDAEVSSIYTTRGAASSNLVVRNLLNETDGTLVNDSSGNGNIGTATNITESTFWHDNITTVTADLTDFGGGASVTMYDDGSTGGDSVADDNIWTAEYIVGSGHPHGARFAAATATDSESETATATDDNSIFLNDDPDSITLNPQDIDENLSAGTTIGTVSATDPDSVDTPTVSIACSTPGADDAAFNLVGSSLNSAISFDFETQSSYSVCLRSDDAHGRSYEETFTITINDTDEVPPVITLTGSDPITVIKNASFTDPGSTCSDDVDSSCTVNVGGATVDTTTLGSYIITYDAVDAAGNNAIQITRTVNVVPGDVPIITRVGAGSVTHEVLTSYTDAGATAADTEDGDITTDIVTVNPVDDTILGNYTVTYDVTDSSNNDAVQVTRIVNVVDTTPPVITLIGSDPITVIKNATYTDAGATASDNYDGNITSSIVTVNPVDTTTLGTYTVTYNVVDSSSNSATQVTRTVNVVAGDTPIITLLGSTPETVEVNTSYADAGATASDTEDGDITANIVTVNSVNTSATGSYIVTYNVDDSSDNPAIQITRTVNVVDTTPPTITLVGADPINIVQGSSFTDPGATCSDNFDTSCSVVVGGDSVDTTRVGTYVIKYDAIDASGNSAVLVTRTVNVTAAPLLINEVEYDTPGNENEAEWFEIYNPTVGTVNIENWTITEKVGASSSKSYTFPSLTIPAGGYIIVTNETADFQLVYPGVTPDLDLPGAQYFNLKNTPSDELELRDPLANSIDYVAWENAGAGWDIEAIDRPICRIAVPDSDTVADWSSDCIPTPGAVNDFNATPTDITLSNNNFDENNTPSFSVGTFTTLDTDISDTHTYSLIAGIGDTDNGSFSISGDTLIFTPIADFETQSSYSIRVETDDGKFAGTYEEVFTISVNDINLAPIDITLTSQDIDENNALGDTIGVFGGVDDGEDASTLSFALACASPGPDDANFNILGTDLNAAAVYDFETKNSYNICVRVSDGVLSYDENFTITINDLDEVPPVVVINPITKLQNSSITDTTIVVTDDVGINIGDVSVDASSTVAASALSCVQTSSIQVDCSISIDASGDLLISALDTSSNSGSDTEINYIVDLIPPQVPNVSVDTTSPYDVDNPELTFSSLDNVGVAYYTVTYMADDGGSGSGIPTTINPATSPLVLALDPDEGLVHTITITVYDVAGNSSTTTISFPPIVTINAPTTLSNTTITDSTVTITTPSGNDIVNVALTSLTTGASLGVCTDAFGGTTEPYINPVTCDINNISSSGTIAIEAEDSVLGAQGYNFQSYIIDTVDPVITITAPTKVDNVAITDTTIVVTDDTAIDVNDVVVSGSSSVTYSGYSCVQTSPNRVDCVIQIDDDGDLQIDALDLAGNNIDEIEPNYIIDTNPPVITLNGVNPETAEYLSSYIDADAIFTDVEDGTGTVLGAGSVNTGILGSYILTYDHTDIAGNPAIQVTRTINVVDTTPPVISLVGSTPETVEVNTNYIDAGATAIDNFDGNLTNSIVTVDSVDITTVGSYTVTYNVTDSNSNVANQVTRTVNVVDTTPPVITLNGSNQIVVPVGGSYSELGATATDNYDSFVPGDITIDSSSVDTSVLGTYYVTYDITDSNSNTAVQVTREVIIEDTVPPVISLIGSDPVTVEVNTNYTDDGATATDNYDGDITANISTTNSVDITTVGTYTVAYDVIDSSGNVATQVTRIVNVVDTTPPVITLTGLDPVTVEVNTSYADAGATASDNNDGNLTSSIVTVDGVDITTVGSYTVTYDVTDSNSNAATQVIRTVNVVDTTPPVITLTGSNPLTLIKNAPYTEFGATCSDNYDTTCTVTIGGAIVDTSTIGTYTVTYNVTDTNSNTALEVIRTVNITAGDTPVITLTGVDPITVEANTSYLDDGATASDTEDGNITSNITTVNPVDITLVGSYTVTYNVTDSSDNIATQVTRNVNVVDTTPPVINLTGSGAITLYRNSSYTEYGAICSDNYDTTCTVTIGGATVDTSTIGTYTVTYNAADTNSNTALQVTRTVNIIAGDTPVITLLGSDPEIVEVNTSYIDPGATASDTEDGNITTSIVTVNGVDITTVGSYTVTYDVTDFSGNTTTQVTRYVVVEDTTPPIITLVGSAGETVNLGDSYTDVGATCSDNYDTTCSVTTNNPVDVNTLGIYIVTYDTTDANGNSAIQVARVVNVVTGDIPTINLNGSSVATVEVNTNYTDLGATAIDTEDGNITADIATLNPVDITTVGTYTVSYNVIDSNSNSAVQVTRTVDIVDTTPPTIALNGNSVETVNLGDPYTDAGATCSDNYDTICTTIDINPVDVNTLGTYTISYDAIDSNGNSAIQVTRTVNVVSGSVPVITLTGNALEILEVFDPYTDAGATANDLEDGDITTNITTVNPVDITTVGVYTVSYDVVDSNSNSASQVVRTVNIVDTTPPTITLQGNNIETVEVGDIYTDAGATCSDNYDTNCNVSVNNPVDTAVLGTYTVTYNTTDSNENIASQVTRTVVVVDDVTDSDGDGLPDVIELIIGTDPSITDTDGDGTIDADNDRDTISPLIELAAPNGGDANGDDKLDAIQNDVSSIESVVSGYSTLDISGSSESSCTQINSFTSMRESILPSQDQDYDYRLGLWDFEISCVGVGSTVDIQIYLDRLYDTRSWIYRKYDRNTQEYTDISSIVSYTTQVVNNIPITVVNYSITDGGIYDEDGIANGIIIDPSGPARRQSRGGSDPVYDRCDGGDTSGSIFDGSCGEEESVAQEEEIPDVVISPEPEIEEEVSVIEPPVTNKDYTLENDFQTCPIIDDINDENYIYPKVGIFSDIDTTVFEEEILKFAQIGIVDGFDDGSFKPFRQMTRTEFLKVALISHCYEYRSENPSDLIYADVDKTSWQAKVIKKAQLLGMINGDQALDGTPIFRPNDIITKSEAVKILMRLSFVQANNPELLEYTDITIDWHKPYIQTGQTLGLFNPVVDQNLFGPDNGVQRQDMIDLINRLVHLYR